MNGAWIVYWDGGCEGIRLNGLFADELEARRYAMDLGYSAEARFWPFGVPWDELP